MACWPSMVKSKSKPIPEDILTTKNTKVTLRTHRDNHELLHFVTFVNFLCDPLWLMDFNFHPVRLGICYSNRQYLTIEHPMPG